MNTVGSTSTKEITAREIMSSPALACREGTHFDELAELLADREISGMPVVNDADEVVGVVSERDLAHALGGPIVRLAISRPAHSGPFLRLPRAVDVGAQRARDIMTSPAVTAHPDTPLHTLAEIMVKEKVNRVPIVRSGKLLAVVTRSDVLGAVAGLDHPHVATEEPPVILGSVWNRVAPRGLVFDNGSQRAASKTGRATLRSGSDRP